MDQVLTAIILGAYIIAGWWGANRTVFASGALFGRYSDILMYKFIVAFVFGWLLFPIALIMSFLGKKK